ncbi:hypothetical protein [Roseateles sp.]
MLSTRAGAGGPEVGQRAETEARIDGVRRGRVEGRWRTTKVLRALRA